MHNMEMAWAFQELADMLEYNGKDFFKIRAYRKAAKIIAGLPEPVEELYRKGHLGKIPGVGKNILAKVGELLDSGKLRKLEGLRRQIPAGLMELMALPGIGPKRARFFFEHLNITSLEQLEEAARKRKIRELPGMGGKIEQDILRNIDMLRRRSGRILLGVARELAAELLDMLTVLPDLDRVAVVGSVRRWQEMVEDIDLLASAKEPEPILAALISHPRVKEVMQKEDNWVKVLTWWGVPVELGVVPPEEYWSALLWSTGSKEHYRGLQLLAREKGFVLKRHGLYTSSDIDVPETYIKVNSEEDIYHHLGLPYIPAEIRENNGEISAGLDDKLPRLVDITDIKGDLHMHTQWSDGVCSIEEMVARAREKGYSYIAITDHSQSLKVAKGLAIEKLEEQHREIQRLNRKLNDFQIFTGMEVDILPKGNLDYLDEILEQADVVVASVHSGFRQDRETMTQRIMSAIKNEHVDIIGHLTGRLLGQRDAYDLDVERILEAAGKYNKVLEINSSPDRLDLNEYHARMAKDYGIKIAINTDAHDLKRMDEMPYGVAVARRAWLEPEDVVNAMEIADLKRIFKIKK